VKYAASSILPGEPAWTSLAHRSGAQYVTMHSKNWMKKNQNMPVWVGWLVNGRAKLCTYIKERKKYDLTADHCLRLANGISIPLTSHG
jgi:hypothetical protein